MHGRASKLAAALLAIAAGVSTASAQQNYSLNLLKPTMDKWIYPFAQSDNGGSRGTSSSFGAIGEAGFDDRDAQTFVAFNTSGIVPAGLDSTNYQILSATFTLTIFREENSSGFVFDGTYDPVSTYGPMGGSINGDDPGRPIELYGAAFRNGFTSSTITEGMPFSTTPGYREGIRSIYPTDFQGGVSINGANRDVSNNVTAGFDPMPFAIGQIAPGDLNPDGTAKDDALVVFTLNLNNPDVLRYLQLSLSDGMVSFIATSLYVASQDEQNGSYPNFYMKENLLGSAPGKLEMQVQVVPEPSAITLALCGFGLFVATWRGRRAMTAQEEIS